MSSDFLDQYLEAKSDGAREVLNDLLIWLRAEMKTYSFDTLALRFGKAVRSKIEEQLNNNHKE